MSSGQGGFLIIEDDVLVARALVRRIKQRGLGECVVARTAYDARARLKDGTPYLALVIDLGLPDGFGLDVLMEARAGAHARTPAVVLSGSYEPRAINRAAALGAKYLVKNTGEWETLATFLEDATSPARIVALVVRSFPFTEAVADVVKRSALGETREAIALARGVSMRTVENQIERAKAQTGHSSFPALVEAVLREVARAR